MKTNETQSSGTAENRFQTKSGQHNDQWKIEALGVISLLGMVVYFLHLSWRKWSDPLIDGYVWYNAWQLSQGAELYRDIPLVYGPLAAYFDATLFKIFGPGMMVLITAHLIIYGIILTLIYLAFRMAWGRLGAFVASAVFISIFSFSQLQQCGNFNFAAPYSHEIVHGTLVIIFAIFITVRWCEKKSGTLAFLFGLCAGLTIVLKPEFMLASGTLAGAVLAVRWFYKNGLSFKEFGLAFLAAMIPTAIFTALFAQTRPWKTALIDASQAWWQVLVVHGHAGSSLQQNAVGINDPWINGFSELAASASAVVVIGCIWFVGWTSNRPWPIAKRIAAILLSIGVIYFVSLRNDWFEVGFCLPGLVAILFFLIVHQIKCDRRAGSRPNQKSIMALMLVLVAGAMMARMFLQARVYDFGFYQAAFAGMVVATAIVIYTPRWVGAGMWGRRLAMCGCVSLVALGCLSTAADSRRVRLAQTHSVGSGLDRFYSFKPNFDSTGALVDSVIKYLDTIPSDAKVLVLPEGALINYISRHKHPLSIWIPLDGGSTPEEAEQIVNRLKDSPPDYIVLISRSMSEHGLVQFGATGTPGEKTLKWITDNYQSVAAKGGNPLAPKEKGAVVLRRKISVGSFPN